MPTDDQSLKANASYTTLIPSSSATLKGIVWYHILAVLLSSLYVQLFRDDIVGRWCLQSAHQAVRHVKTELNINRSTGN